jgi:hypothetical protein
MNQVDGQPADLGGLWNKLEGRLPEKKAGHKKPFWLAAASVAACLMAGYFFYNPGPAENEFARVNPSLPSNSNSKNKAIDTDKTPFHKEANTVNITASNKRQSAEKIPASTPGEIITTTEPVILHQSAQEITALQTNTETDSSSLSIARNMQAPAHDIPIPLFASKKLKVVHINELQPADANQASIENDPGFRSIRIKLMRQQSPDMSATNQSPSDNLLKIKLPQN